MMLNHTKESLKFQAKTIRKFLNDKYNVDVSHGHCMELISQLFGFKDWNTASASLKSKNTDNQLPIYIRTVGDMKRALSLFDDEAMLDGEYDFKLKDFLNDVDPSEIDGTITQEFSLVLTQLVPDMASFKLTLEHESITLQY